VNGRLPKLVGFRRVTPQIANETRPRRGQCKQPGA
jgi:hypothetical protein